MFSSTGVLIAIACILTTLVGVEWAKVCTMRQQQAPQPVTIVIETQRYVLRQGMVGAMGDTLHVGGNTYLLPKGVRLEPWRKCQTLVNDPTAAR